MIGWAIFIALAVIVAIGFGLIEAHASRYRRACMRAWRDRQEQHPDYSTKE